MEHPENTIEAFEGAILAGADMVELDVRMTADHVPVVLHDAGHDPLPDIAGPLDALVACGAQPLSEEALGRMVGDGAPTLIASPHPIQTSMS